MAGPGTYPDPRLSAGCACLNHGLDSDGDRVITLNQIDGIGVPKQPHTANQVPADRYSAVAGLGGELRRLDRRRLAAQGSTAGGATNKRR
jgi:hypothetical protein